MLGAWALAVVAQAGCAEGHTALEAGVYRSGPVAFRVAEAPSSWRPIHVEEASLAFRDDAHSASVLVNARCGRKDADTPLVALTAHLVMGTTERKVSLEDVIPMDGREALHTRMRAKLDGVPKDYDLYVLKKDGCVYDFVYVAEPTGGDPPPPPPTRDLAGDAISDAGVTANVSAPREPRDPGAAAFETFVMSFHTLPASGEP